MKRLFLAVLCLFASPPLAEGAHGSTRLLCVSCGLKKPVAFAVQELGLSPSSDWFMLDVNGDSDWEIAILSADLEPKVGVYDPSSSSWMDGPHALNAKPNLWFPVDWDGDGGLDYVYVDGLRLVRFDPQTGTHELLWTHSAPVFSLYALRASESQKELVAVVQSGWDCPGFTEVTAGCFTTTVFSPADGTILTRIGGSTIRPVPLQNLPGLENALMVHEPYWFYSVIPGGPDGWIVPQRLNFVDSNWVIRGTIYLASDSRGGNFWRLRTGGMIRSANGYNLLYWMADIAAGNGAWATTAFGCASGWNAKLWAVNFPDSGRYVGMTAFDLDPDEVEEVILPLSAGGWERRSATNGSVVDTLQGLPAVRIVSYPVISSGSLDLIYMKDSALYIYASDIPTGVFDDPQLVDSDSGELTLVAHPNPFNSAVTIAWSNSEIVTLTIHNILGQTVRTFDASALSGNSTITWDGLDARGRHVTSGVYFARLVTGDQVATAKLVLLR